METKTKNKQSSVPITGDSYMTFVSDAKVGDKICIEVKYPKGENVWIDWNDNKQLDEGEQLNSVEYEKSIPDGFSAPGDYYDVIGNLTLKKSKFTIYGAVTYLFCSESELSQIDVSNNPKLKTLVCHSNNLTSLDISKNKNLELLFCTNNELTDLDISNNPKLNSLTLPRKMKSKVFNFTPEIKKLAKIFNQQNLIPKGYHIAQIASNYNSDKSDANKDQLIFIDPDIPYAEREDMFGHSKLMYFKHIGNNKYKMIGEADMALDTDFSFENESTIVETIWENESESTNEYYIIQDGKIINKRELIKPNAEGIYEVKTADELLRCIASDRTIKIMADTINLEESKLFSLKTADNLCQHEILGLVFPGIKNLTITGGLDKRTELFVNNSTYTVLTFFDSENIKLENLRMGHHTSSDCNGAVLAFVNCRKVNLDNLLLYGCGTQGITTCSMEQLNCKNTIIEDCAINALLLNGCKNSVFENCNFKNNELSGALIKMTNSQNLTFKNIAIKNNETGYIEETYIIDASKDCKSITFENVELKDNKTKGTCNNENVAISN